MADFRSTTPSYNKCRPTFAWRNVAVVRSWLLTSTSDSRATEKPNKTRMCLDVNRLSAFAFLNMVPIGESKASQPASSDE